MMIMSGMMIRGMMNDVNEWHDESAVDELEDKLVQFALVAVLQLEVECDEVGYLNDLL